MRGQLCSLYLRRVLPAQPDHRGCGGDANIDASFEQYGVTVPGRVEQWVLLERFRYCLHDKWQIGNVYSFPLAEVISDRLSASHQSANVNFYKCPCLRYLRGTPHHVFGDHPTDGRKWDSLLILFSRPAQMLAGNRLSRRNRRGRLLEEAANVFEGNPPAQTGSFDLVEVDIAFFGKSQHCG